MRPSLPGGGRVARCTSPHRARALVALVALSLGGTTRAHAHDPAFARDLIFAGEQGGSPAVIVSNRGLVFVDDGDTSDTTLRCSETYGVSTAYAPSVLRSPAGGLLLGFYDGLSHTADRACSQQERGLDIPSPGNVVRVAGDALLVASQSSTAPVVYVSDDEGETFRELYTLDQPGSYFERLRVAPSDPARVYAAGFASKDGMAGSLCAVSEDAGENWTVRDVEADVKVFAVDPGDPDIVFAHKAVDAYKTVFQVLRSDDACASFEVVLDMVPIPTSLTGPADSGERFLGLRTVGGKGGLYRSLAPGEPFERVLEDQVQTVTCLEQRGDRLWICANVLPNTEGVYTSEDGAETIETFLTMADVARPVVCEEAAARAECAEPWEDFYSELHPEEPENADAGAVDAGAVDSGVVDAAMADTGGEDSGLGDGAISGDASVDAGDAGDPSGGGSGCTLIPARQGNGWGLLALSCLLVLGARRRGRSA